MFTITPLTILGVLLVYAALFFVITRFRRRIEPVERRTFLVIGGAWAVSTFVGNYLLFRSGLMSFLPWINNFVHTFIWIGICLTWMYIGVRERRSMVVQCALFFVFSLVVKYAERLLFGTWDLDHFLHVFKGNFAYIMGWSLADGLYPILTLYGLRLISKWINGLIVIGLLAVVAAGCARPPATLVPVPDADNRVQVETGSPGWEQQLSDLTVCVMRVNRAGDCTRSPSPPVCDSRTREEVLRVVQPILDSIPRVKFTGAFSMNRDLKALFPSATPTMEVIDARRTTPCWDWSGGACAAIRTQEIAFEFEGTADNTPERITVLRVAQACTASRPDQ